MVSLFREWQRGDWPWPVRAYALAVLAGVGIGLAISRHPMPGPYWLFISFYVLMTTAFIASRNDWLRFAITGLHLVTIATIVFALVVVLPERGMVPMLPARIAFMSGLSVVVIALLWHPATGRWMHER